MENRFIDMNTLLKKKAGTNGRSSYTNGVTGKASGQSNGYARSMGAVDYTIPGLVAPLRQASTMACWATVATMMIMWKKQASISVENAIADVGQRYLTILKNNTGLSASDKVDFLRDAGFAFEYPSSFSIEGWEGLLKNYGPIWVTTDNNPGIHARVIIAIHGDGTPSGTSLTIIDPAGGNQYDETFDNFLVKYEREVRNSGANWSGRIQIVHWPAGVSVAKSFSTGRTQSWMISQRGIDMIKSFEGFRANLYNDPVGHCTIGYGTLIHKGNCNGDSSEQPFTSGVTDEQATRLLIDKLNEFQKTVNDSVTVELSQNQYDSLVSFTYNVGSGNFSQSTLLRLLNQGNYNAVPTEMRKWTKAHQNGQVVELPGLVRRRNAEAELFASPTVSSAQSIYDQYSRPFYDTGEHAIFGEYLDATVNGPIANVAELQPSYLFNINGTSFTYGQIITLGDFYDNYTQLTQASASEISTLKGLIVKSENFYKNAILKIASADKNPADAEYNAATGGRYIELALGNYSHFAPPFSTSVFAGSTKPNNKSTWEQYHALAIQMARKGTNSNDLNEALKVNAFGDHFLTDAFSAGHLINKENVIAMFKTQVLDSSNNVNSDGSTLFGKISQAAFVGPVAQEFSKYQTSDTKYGINLFLDSAANFKTFLTKAMEKQPDEISNIIVKVVHDALNKSGVRVTNAKGQTWQLTGDGYLNKENITKVQQAVAQSVNNVRDSITDGATSIQAFEAKAWAFVPNPNDPATKQVVSQTMMHYTNPATADLAKDSAELIKNHYLELIEALKKQGKIQSRQSGPLHPINTIGNWINR